MLNPLLCYNNKLMNTSYNKFNNNSWNKWSIIPKWTQRQIWAIGEALVREWFTSVGEPLRPIGFEHASQITKDYRQELESKAKAGHQYAIDEMNFFQWKFKYNQDGTVDLLQFTWSKTFCPDLTGTCTSMDRDAAKWLADSKWYHLLSDWCNWNSEEEKEKTDWYKLEKYFGDYAHTWAIACMLGCEPAFYWTNTEHYTKGWVKSGSVCTRNLSKFGCKRYLAEKNDINRVCGFKNAM